MSGTCLRAKPRARPCLGCLQSLLGRFSFAPRACFTCCEGHLRASCTRVHSYLLSPRQVSRLPGRPGHS